MSLINGEGLSAADVAAVTGNGGFGSFWWGGDGAWLILILLLFAAFNGNGWGGNWEQFRTVQCGSSESVSIRNTSAIPILVENANVIFSR